MKSLRCHLAVAICSAAIAIVPLTPSLFAQTVLPRPNFSVRTNPQFWFNTWPADFNRDGRTDLIAGAGPQDAQASDLLVAIGRGDGTFGTPRALGIPAQPLGTGDFNGDSRIDVLVFGLSGVAVLPGNGDGTFGTLRSLGTTDTFEPFAAIADFNGDRRRDAAVQGRTAAGASGLLVFPGNGDFTFGPPVELATPTGEMPIEAIAADFNGDGRRDIAVVTLSSAAVFINRGGLLFERRQIAVGPTTPPTPPFDLMDVTAADLNRDSKLDLIFAASGVGISTALPGRVLVLFGRGDGTFGPAKAYDTWVRGELTIVAGDFNRDGRIDVATGNWSPHHEDEVGGVLWDSISILRGDGTGQLLRPVTYPLGTGFPTESNWYLTHNSLNTSDLNGDRQTDLIASPGAILLNRAAAPNRRPTVSAGADFAILEDQWPFILEGSGSDPDRHWIFYTWTDQNGIVLGRSPWIPVYDRLAPGESRTYTLTGTDAQGGTARDQVTVSCCRVPEQ